MAALRVLLVMGLLDKTEQWVPMVMVVVVSVLKVVERLDMATVLLVRTAMVRVLPDGMVLVVPGMRAVRWLVVPVRNVPVCIGKHPVQIRSAGCRLAVLWNICVVRMVLAVRIGIQWFVRPLLRVRRYRCVAVLVAIRMVDVLQHLV